LFLFQKKKCQLPTLQIAIIQAKMMNILNLELSVKTIVSYYLFKKNFLLNQFFSFIGEVHFKVKMTTSMGKLKKSYAERQGTIKRINLMNLIDLF
jgi:hypothetical protein